MTGVEQMNPDCYTLRRINRCKSVQVCFWFNKKDLPLPGTKIIGENPQNRCHPSAVSEILMRLPRNNPTGITRVFRIGNLLKITGPAVKNHLFGFQYILLWQ